MSEFLKELNNFSGLIALLTILATIIIGIVTIWVNVIQKKLTCQLVSLNKIINVKDSSLDEKLKMIYEDNEIKNPVLIEMKLENLGNKPITEENFRTNIIIDFSNKLEIFKSECIFSESEQYRIDPLKINNNRAISLPGFSLNSKKSITLKIIGNLLQEIKNSDIKIDAHIIGVELKKLKSIESTRRSEIITHYIINLIPIVAFVMFFAFVGISSKYNGIGQNMSIVSFMILLFSAPISSLTSLEFIWKKSKGR